MTKKTKAFFHVFSLLIVIISFSLLFTKYSLTLRRLIESFNDLKEAFSLWWKVSITKELEYNSVEFIPSFDILAIFNYIEFDVSEWVIKFKFLPDEMFNLYNFKMFSFWFLIQNIKALLYFTVTFTVLTVIETLLDVALTTPSKHPGEDTFLLKLFKVVEKPFCLVFKLIYNFILLFITSRYWILFLFVWSVNFNLGAVLVEFLSFIFGFPLSANLNGLFIYIAMFISDILIGLLSAPFFVWVIIFYVIIYKLRLARGYAVLNHLYNYDVGFLKGCAYNVLLDGPTGASKTKTVVQMALMTEDYFHSEQWNSMYKSFQRFPEFPFYHFEQDLKEKIEKGIINNMHTARNYVECLRCEVLLKPVADKLYNYTGKMYYNDGVRFVHIWEVLENYAQLYYMYGNDTSSIIANLSIRSDLRLVPGHFPMWDNRLLKRGPEHYIKYSKYCHIMDLDMFRYSKLVADEPPKVNLEYGVNVFTELDKDQGNQFTNKIYDIKDDTANPLNDGYDLFLMLERHLGTVDYKCYIRNFADIQRDGTLREGVKGLYDELNISDKKEPKLALPFFFEAFFMNKLEGWFNTFTKDIKSYGTVNTLTYYILRRILFPLFNWFDKIKQQFTFEELTFTIKSSCSPEGTFKQHDFYILYCIAHSERYSTDCYAALNDEAAKYSEGGIQDIPCYEGKKPALHELPKHNSYFSNKQLARLERIKNSKIKK